MKTFVLWTHYDCEVYASLHSSRLNAYKYLAQNWLEECDPDDEDYSCGHESLETNEEIANALEYHNEEMSYDINEMEVPLAPMELPESVESPPEPPASFVVSAEQTGDLLNALQSFKGQ